MSAIFDQATAATTTATAKEKQRLDLIELGEEFLRWVPCDNPQLRLFDLRKRFQEVVAREVEWPFLTSPRNRFARN